MNGLVIEPAREVDLDAIDDIEQHSFKSPWSRATLAAELDREWARIDVARIAARIVAFCNYWLVTARSQPPRRDGDPPAGGGGGELNIHAIATHPDFRGRGIAAALLDYVLAVARGAGCSLATLEVRRSNRPAIALYEHAGFATIHVRARYYQDDDEDALVMARSLGVT